MLEDFRVNVLNMFFLYIPVELDIVISSAMFKATEFVFANCSK